MNKTNTLHILKALIKNDKTYYWELVSDGLELCEIQLGEGSLYESIVFRHNKYLETFNIDRGNGYGIEGPFHISTLEGQLCETLFDTVLETIKSPRYAETDKATLADSSHWFILAHLPASINKERSFYLSL